MINVKINGRVFYKLLLVRGSELIPSEGNHVLALIQIIPTCSCENCMRFDYNLGFTFLVERASCQRCDRKICHSHQLSPLACTFVDHQSEP